MFTLKFVENQIIERKIYNRDKQIYISGLQTLLDFLVKHNQTTQRQRLRATLSDVPLHISLAGPNVSRLKFQTFHTA